jgi:hypothetical protein
MRLVQLDRNQKNRRKSLSLNHCYMRAGENKVNPSDLENRVEPSKPRYNDPPRDVELSPGTNHRKQMASSRVGGPSATMKKKSKQKNSITGGRGGSRSFNFNDTSRVSQRLLTTKGG